MSEHNVTDDHDDDEYKARPRRTWTFPHGTTHRGKKKTYDYDECLERATRGVGAAWWLVRAMYCAGWEWDVDRAEYLLWDLEEVVRRAREELAAVRDDRKHLERVAALRNVDGRTPEEAAAFRAKADELEAKRGAA